MRRKAEIELKLSINELFDSAPRFRVVGDNENGKAVFTHFIHESLKSKYNKHKNEAIRYLMSYLENTYQYKVNKTQVGSLVDEMIMERRKLEESFPAAKKPKFEFIDLFAGIGGIRVAAQNAGGLCVFSSENDIYAQHTYFNNFKEYPFGDITSKDTKEYIPKGFDLLCAGFPCQPFSYAGRNEGFEDKTRGTLFFDILDILKRFKPKMFLLENVKGIKSHDGGKTLKIIEGALQKLGYNIHWQILNSYDFGLPQYRERWYCVGFRTKVDFKFPVGEARGVTLKSIIKNKFNKDKKLRLSEFEIQRIKYHFKSKEERVKHDNSMYAPNTKKGRHGVYSYQKPDGSLRFHIGDAAKTQIQEAFYACVDSYAPTIIANRVPKLWDLERKLSVEESLGLQGFPEEFEFNVSDNQAYKQLGNSVAVPVVESIIKNMIEASK